MPARLKVYLDTSVISAFGDARWPERQLLTREFFARFDEFAPCTSEVAISEINRTRDPARRAEMLSLLERLTLLPLDTTATMLSNRYLDAGIFPDSVPDDALHVAVAVLTGQNVIVSWNFKHLVNLRRKAAVLALNQSLGYRTPDIITPPEV